MIHRAAMASRMFAALFRTNHLNSSIVGQRKYLGALRQMGTYVIRDLSDKE